MDKRLSAKQVLLFASMVVVGCGTPEAFCRPAEGCIGDGCGDAGVTESSCVDFDEAAELAKDPRSGVHTLTTSKTPPVGGAVTPTASNDGAICKNGTCYLRSTGVVQVYAVGSPGQLFTGWSGCSDSKSTQITLSSVKTDTACVAHFAPAFIVVNAQVQGLPDGHVALSASSGCSANDGCVVSYGGSMTLTAPSDPRYAFSGWSGCSDQSTPTIVLQDIVAPVPTCVATFTPIVP